MREHVRTTIPAYDSDHPFFFTVFDDSHQFHLWIVSKNFTLIVTRYQVCTYECIRMYFDRSKQSRIDAKESTDVDII